MNSSEIYLICFGIGSLWTIASFFLGGAHGAHGHAHAGGHVHHGGHGGSSGFGQWLGLLFTPSGLGVFLAWFGGIGYILTRHSSFGRWLDLAIAILVGTFGAFLIGVFLRWLQSHEQPLEATDTDLIGMLGRLSCAIRPNGVGEMIFVRDGSRRAVPARSEDGSEIPREEEVVITRYEKGIAFVRTWAALTQPEADSPRSENSAKGD